jgi:hypothetical protein
MAKMRIRRAAWKGFAHRLPITASIGKSGNYFEVCVTTGAQKRTPTRGGFTRHLGDFYACRVDTNPRKALASALSTVAAKLRKRSGAFAGMR